MNKNKSNTNKIKDIENATTNKKSDMALEIVNEISCQKISN